MSTIPFRIQTPHLTASSNVSTDAPDFDREAARQFDQYYTDPILAAAYLQTTGTYFDLKKVPLFEPSAGDGSFSNIMPVGRIAIDIAPRGARIREANFLEFPIESDRPIGFIGNPPYGRCSNMALAFINRAAPHAKFIAFILPRTFRKAETQAKIDQSLHLLHDEDVPADAFLFCGEPYSVPAVFQIWESRPYLRDLPSGETEHPDFAWTTRERADFVVQRTGADAGRIHYNFDLSESSNLFILGKVQHRMRRLNLAAVAANTAGNPSISKSEIVRLYSQLTGRPPIKPRSKARQIAMKKTHQQKGKS